MNTKYKIYLDMDGVLADFDKKIEEITNGESKQPNFPKGKLWKAVKQYNYDVAPYFESLPKMSGADELVEFVTSNFENVGVLTATGSTPGDAAQQKKNWIAKHYPQLKNVITVGASREKAVYANPNTILIDDREKSIDPWRRAGGFGILFKNNAQAISEIEKVL